MWFELGQQPLAMSVLSVTIGVFKRRFFFVWVGADGLQRLNRYTPTPRIMYWPNNFFCLAVPWPLPIEHGTRNSREPPMMSCVRVPPASTVLTWFASSRSRLRLTLLTCFSYISRSKETLRSVTLFPLPQKQKT